MTIAATAERLRALGGMLTQHTMVGARYTMVRCKGTSGTGATGSYHRGGIVNRTYAGHKNYLFTYFLLRIFDPIYNGPP